MYKSATAAVFIKIDQESEEEYAACLGQANLSSTANVDSRNCIGQSQATKTAMSLDWNMQFNGIAELEASGIQEKLFKAHREGKDVQITIIYQDTPADGFQGSGVISDFAVNLSAPGVAEVSFTLQGSSELELIHTHEGG